MQRGTAKALAPMLSENPPSELAEGGFPERQPREARLPGGSWLAAPPGIFFEECWRPSGERTHYGRLALCCAVPVQGVRNGNAGSRGSAWWHLVKGRWH